jgi:alpha-beta hydrolase superfamily lysophospholipase
VISFVLPASDNVSLNVYHWPSGASPKAAVQIVHGLGEHAGRYARLAIALSGAGYVSYGGDHRGHGRTAMDSEHLGFFAESEGWRKCMDDVLLLNRHIAATHPGLPIFMLGHSMGSFMAQQFICANGESLAGVVLSGSDGAPSVLAAAGRLIARLEKLRLGAHGRSPLIHALTFGAFNKPFRPARSAFDWLSRDPEEVDRYTSDPLCGFVPTVQLWIDLLDAWACLSESSRLTRIPKSLPIHVIAGACDPVSANTRGLEKLLAAYHRAGLERVTHHFYSGARHELFHETNRAEVMHDLIEWLNGVVESLRPSS